MPKYDLLKFSTNLAYLALLGSIITIAGYVSVIPLLIFLAAFIPGLLIDNQKLKIRPPDSRYIFLFIFCSLLASLFRIDLQNLFDRVLGVLLIIIGAKLIMPKKHRDILQVYLLNLFLIASAALIRFGIEFGLMVLAETFISITGLMLVYGSLKQKEISYSDLKAVFRFSGIISLTLIPSTIFFFIIIPRPTWTLFAWGGGVEGKTGFSDRVTPGDVEQIKIDRTPAFRVRWINGPRPARPLWRGMVYDAYRGGGWEKTDTEKQAFPVVRGKTMEYEVLLEPSGLRYLPALELPGRIEIHKRRSNLIPGYTIYVHRLIERRILYHVWSIDRPYIPADRDPERYLDMPPELKGRIAPIAERFSSPSARTAAGEMEAYFRIQFKYSLKPGAGGDEPILHFLTVSREGHCEYFATAMVFMLRSLGIPARVVGGYAGGEWNELGHYYLVNQSDAHTWVEVWVRDKGWLAFDPTPGTGPAEGPVTTSKIFRLIDYVRYKWYYWVMQYDLEKQIGLARQATSFLRSVRSKKGLAGVDFKTPARVWLILPAGLIILFTGFRTVRSYVKQRPKTMGERFVRIFQKRGFEKKSGETMREFVRRIDFNSLPLNEKTVRFIDCYYEQEFGRKDHKQELMGLLSDIEQAFREAQGMQKPQGSGKG